MRCHYLSDLHLESQEFPFALPKGDVLVIAGDTCHARCLDPSADDPYAARQRERVLRFADSARANFTRVLMIAGNHEHYEGVVEDSVPLMRRHLPGIEVLDDGAVEIEGVAFFGTTLWSDFDGRDAVAMERARRGMGEFFFARRRGTADATPLEKFRPHHALEAFDRARTALAAHLERTSTRRTVVVSHHAPSRRGLNPLHQGNGLDGAYASDLDGFIAALETVPAWIHGHTHVRRRYRIGTVTLYANCRGFDERERGGRPFAPTAHFDL